jgi:hypothetical protein
MEIQRCKCREIYYIDKGLGFYFSPFEHESVA